MVQAYWQVGRLIVEHEQAGEADGNFGGEEVREDLVRLVSQLRDDAALLHQLGVQLIDEQPMQVPRAAEHGMLLLLHRRAKQELARAARRALGERHDAVLDLFVSLDPDKVLGRGYVRVTGPNGRTLTSMAAAARETALALHFRDGELAVSTGAAPVRAAPRPKAPPPSDDGPQGKLL